jgi:flavin reductase (DIM6/NTAB) family NADH-FMN oxidoreductase RutF
LKPKKTKIKAYRLFYPQIAVVIASRKEYRVEAVAINSAISVSYEHPKVVWAIKREASILGIVRKSKFFSLNWMDSKYAKSVDYLGFEHARTSDDEIVAAGLTWLPGKKSSTPMVTEAEAVLECELDRIVHLGDNDLVIGSVLSARAGSDFSEYWRFKTYKPLIYFGAVPGKKKGRYGGLTKEGERWAN